MDEWRGRERDSLGAGPGLITRALRTLARADACASACAITLPRQGPHGVQGW